LLDVLKEKGVHATFFLSGFTFEGKGNPVIDARRATVKRAHDEGHLLANHGYKHLPLTTLQEVSRMKGAFADLHIYYFLCPTVSFLANSSSNQFLSIHPTFHVQWQVRDELQQCEAVILDITGQRPRFFRPPFGSLDEKTRNIVCE
jgi:peptidoglycan/xylan/chitin deacetylase (PgdA/CDA1 family)